jgi:hypothetical protein
MALSDVSARKLKTVLKAAPNQTAPERAGNPLEFDICQGVDLNSYISSGRQEKVLAFENALVSEQVIQFPNRRFKSNVFAHCKVSSAVRGERQTGNLREVGYLLRMEALDHSEGIHLAGFQIGPWSEQKINLEKGGLLLPNPLWFGFEPTIVETTGRLFLEDEDHQEIFNIPWTLVAILPGEQPLP